MHHKLLTCFLVKKVGNLSSFRDFLDAKDVLRAYKLLIESDLNEQVFNICSGKEVKIEDILKAYIEKNNFGIGKVMNVLRLTIVGALTGPHLYDIMELIGKEEVISRIKTAIKNISIHH